MKGFLALASFVGLALIFTFGCSSAQVKKGTSSAIVGSMTQTAADAIIAAPVPTPVESSLVVKPGNCLWNISKTVYGTPWDWPIIWRENRDYIIDPFLIEPGDILNIPEIEKGDDIWAHGVAAGEPSGDPKTFITP